VRTKSIAIWLLTSITFISLVHLIEAIMVFMFNNPIRLLQLYPYGNVIANSLTAQSYLYITATATAVLWAATCLVAFNNPVESYVNKHVQTDEKFLQDRAELLNRMCETVESDHQTLTKLTDIMRNMQKGENVDEDFTTATPKIPTGIGVKSRPILTKGFPSIFNAKVKTKPKTAKKKNGSKKGNVKTHGASLSLQRKMKQAPLP
jgi:hypothetical protein